MSDPKWRMLTDEKSREENRSLIPKIDMLQKSRKWPWSKMNVEDAVEFSSLEFDLAIVLKAARDYGYAQGKRFGVIQTKEDTIRIVRVS